MQNYTNLNGREDLLESITELEKALSEKTGKEVALVAYSPVKYAALNDDVEALAKISELELQQTVVDGWKAASANGKLSEDEIAQLGTMLVQKTTEKMSDSAKNLLNSAGVDITAIIKGAGEAMIKSMKK